MIVRAVGRAERARLRPWEQPWSPPYVKKLDADDVALIVRLYRTGQESKRQLAARFGISVRTVDRYLSSLKAAPPIVLDSAGQRVIREAKRMGIALTPMEAHRLATAALMDRPA